VEIGDLLLALLLLTRLLLAALLLLTTLTRLLLAALLLLTRLLLAALLATLLLLAGLLVWILIHRSSSPIYWFATSIARSPWQESIRGQCIRSTIHA
jgi:hypothetical protein